MRLLAICALLAGCGSNIEKQPNTVYVVVNNSTNNTNGGSNGTNGSENNANTNNANTNNATPNNVTPNNVTPTNNMTSPNNVTPTNNMTSPNNMTPTNNTPAGDACNNDHDLTAVTTIETPIIARDCTVGCLQDPDQRGCTAMCVENEIGVSEACSFCIADLSQCGVQNCFGECVEDPYAPACTSCLELHCEDDFVACAGIPSR